MEALENCFDIKDAWLNWLNVEPVFDRLKGEPRFIELKEKVDARINFSDSFVNFSADESREILKNDQVDAEKLTTSVQESSFHDRETMIMTAAEKITNLKQGGGATNSRKFIYFGVAAAVLLTIFGLYWTNILTFSATFGPKTTQTAAAKSLTMVVLPLKTVPGEEDYGIGVAESREGKIQVELAQLRYLLPRLTTKHSAMSRLTGGIGGRGPGETKLEIDRRRAQDRITALQREVQRLGQRRRLRRHVRSEKSIPTVSIVGYTNAGKSTLLNRLTNSEVVARDELFATLNPVSRRLRFPEEREVIITDTVGFIRELPPDLMDAFKTTFEEIEPAHLLLHVLDASDPRVDERYATVRSLLSDLGFESKPTVVVLNKSDRCDVVELHGLARRYDGIPVCALDPATFGPVLDAIAQGLWPQVQSAAATFETPLARDVV